MIHPGAPRRIRPRRSSDPSDVGNAVGELLGLWHTGGLRPLVGAELPLDEVEQAHALVESRKSVGKVVLIP